jgi:hypothetical protein
VTLRGVEKGFGTFDIFIDGIFIDCIFKYTVFTVDLDEEPNK